MTDNDETNDAAAGNSKAIVRAKRKRRGKKVRSKSSESQSRAGRAKGGTGRTFPRESLERAVRVASALRDKNGGKPWPPQDIANVLDLSATSTAFFYLAAAARDYGLTEGGRDSAMISLTELGKALVYPASAEEEATAKLKAFRNIEAFAAVLDHYGGNRLPELQYAKNTLNRDFSIEDDHHEDFVKLFKANCAFVGLKEGQDLPEQALVDRQVAPATRKDDATGTITVAEPNELGKGVCFVIMPFTERAPERQKHFFNEVLTRLITPACIDAGFRVVTADRRGSDVIHSTIVNSLLDADLVVADLTDHNPNVLFELSMRMHEDKPIALIQADGTARIFDVDKVLRVYAYNPNLWTSTLETDKPALVEHIRAVWDNRDGDETYMKLLRRKRTP
ncbi:MAG TPA: hypothetical protein VHC69_34005 [Polyangiaceae bacterium]|nr:hypothetical protein [Polyangiaceae bacterium]